MARPPQMTVGFADNEVVHVVVDSMPESGASLTATELRAVPLHVIVDEQPASGAGLTDDELRASPVPVSGTVAVSNLPATQPISGAVSVSNLPATQPVSGTVAVSNFPASQAVTGTFWQATQPVSGTVTANTGLSPLTDAQLRAAAVPVSLASVPSHSVTVTPPALTIRNGTRAAAPAANAVLADTGQLAAGSYRVEWNCVAMDTLAVGKGCIVEHRNAANNANIAVLGGCVAGESQTDVEDRITIATNERVRVTVGSAAGAASSLYGASVAAYLL